MTRKAAATVLITLFLLQVQRITAQSVGIGTTSPDSSALLDLKDTARGFLMPRLTTVQMNAINNPAAGLAVYNTDSSAACFYTGSAWIKIITSASQQTQYFSANGTHIYNTNSGNVGIGTSSPAGKLHVLVTESAEVLDQSNPNGSSFTMNTGNSWQSFTAGITGYLTKISVQFAVGATSTRTITIYEGEGTSGTNLGSATFTAVSGGWADCSLPNLLLTSGTQYTIFMDNGSYWFTQVPGTYAGGRSNGNAANDKAFNTYMLSYYDFVTGTNGVGIGTTSPSEKLEVIGKTKTNSLQITNGATNGYVLQSDASGNASWNAAATGSAVVAAGAGLSYAGNTLNSVWSTSGSNIYNNTADHTGIGTATPASRLEVAATDITSLTVSSSNTEATDFVIKNSTIGNSTLRWTGPANTFGQQKLMFVTPGSDVTMTLDQVQNYVGIGTTSPVAKLDVNGNIRTSGFQLTNGFADGYILQSDATGAGNWVAASTAIEAGTGLSYSGNTLNTVWTASGNNIYNNNSANVGIGTTTPVARLHVYNGSGTSSITIQSATSNANINLNNGGSGFESSVATFTNGSQRWSFGKSNGAESGSDAGSDFFINRYNDAAVFQSQPLVIKRSTGYVGINQGNPVQQLDVNGNINTSTGNGYYIGSAKVLSINGSDNVFAGVSAGAANTGTGNTFIGKTAGQANTGGDDNTALGYAALNSNTTGNFNTALGTGSGIFSSGGSNVFVGHSAGALSGSNNVMIGFAAGSAETGSNKLYIDNSNTASPLVYGDFSKDSMSVNGSLNIAGAMGLKVKTSQVAGTNNPNATGGIWIYSSGTGTIDLSSADYTDRVVIILNNTGATRTISTYRDLGNTAQTTIANNVSLWLVYDGTSWRQIK